jgi:DNA-directed RNA polymerase subunit M/transcription elongation factor TFIIS
MNFCPDCESYLVLRIVPNDNPNKILNLECNNCGYKKNIDIAKEPEYKCVYHYNYNVKKISIDQKNIQYLDNDPTLPHVNNIPCPNAECPTNKQVANPEVLTGDTKPLNNVLYIRLEESTLTYMYQCCNCKHTWTNK